MRYLAELAATSCAIVMLTVTPAAASSPYPVGPPRQPPTYGDCVSTTAAGEGVEDYTVDVKTFTRLVGPVPGERPGVDDTLACKGFSPPQ